MNQQIREQIDEVIRSNAVVLFMKGNRAFPQCGFSARLVEILEKHVADFRAVNILEDSAMRQELKEYTDWPTFPQLYVNGQFVGGSDIVAELDLQGQLTALLKQSE